MIVFVENLEFIGKHGVYENERRDGRRFKVDFSVELPPAGSDHINETIDYRALAEIVIEIGAGPSVKLVETLGEQMIATVFERYPEVEEAEVTIRKKATGVPGAPEWVGVSLARVRDV